MRIEITYIYFKILRRSEGCLKIHIGNPIGDPVVKHYSIKRILQIGINANLSRKPKGAKAQPLGHFAPVVMLTGW